MADRRAKREIVAVENDLAKWEDMLGLPGSGCEWVVEDAKRYISMSCHPLAAVLHVLDLVH